VAATFQKNVREDPKQDVEHSRAQLLQPQLRSYKKDDPKEKQQKALPVCFICLILEKATEHQQAMGELVGATYFWATLL
jgi:hypothetical protein